MAIIDKSGLHGPVQNIVYRTYRGKQIAQIKPAKVKQTLASKEAGLEFGLAATTAAAIRSIYQPIFAGHDGGMANRLTSLTLKSIKTAYDKARGERDIHDGDAGMFCGFQFNKNSPLESSLRVRPEVHLNNEDLLKISIPAFTPQDLRGPSAAYYVIRFLLVSFNFKTKVASYLSNKEIRIERGQGFTGGEIETANQLPKGRLVFLTMSIYAYEKDHYDGYRSLNSKEWSPAGIIGAWQVPAETTTGKESFIEEERKVVGNAKLDVFQYGAEGIMKKFRDLWDKQKDDKHKISKKPITETRVPPPDLGSELPVGDFSF